MTGKAKPGPSTTWVTGKGQAWALHDLGAVQRLTEDYPAAAASLTRALQTFRDLGDRQGQARALHDLGVVQRLTRDYPAATASLTRALQLFRDLGDRYGQAAASINLGELLSLSLAYREARGCFAQALGIARDINAPVQEARASRESDDATSGKETLAKAPHIYDKPWRSTGASEPPRPSASKRPS